MPSQLKEMKDMVARGRAIDISGCAQPPEWDGDYLLPPRMEQHINAAHGPDFCHLKEEQWVWWIGRQRRTGKLRASLAFRSGLNGKYDQLFQR